MDAQINGHNCHYVVQGDENAPAVIFVHGFPFSHDMWATQLADLPESMHAIAYDIRGYGSSSSGDGHPTMELYVDDLIALMDHLQVEAAVLCGLSMGGYIVLRGVERHPARVKALVLCNTRSQPDSDEGRLNRAAAIRKIELEGVAVFVESFMGKLFTPATLAAESESVSSIREIMMSTPVATYSGGLLAMAARTDTTPSLAKFDKPALLLFAQEDTLMPPSEGEAMARLLPNAVLHVVPGAAHLSNMENSMEFNRHLIPFLESVTRD